MPYEDALRRLARADIGLGIFGTSDKSARVVPHKVFQSMALGVPVITRRSPAIAEFFRDEEHLVLVPAGDAEHQEYASIRGDLALPQNVLLPITPRTPNGRTFGLHPGLPELQALFGQNRFAMVANVGTLVEPTTLDQFRHGSVALPLGLFSHSDQSMQWQSSLPDSRAAIGWAGRMADVIQTGNCNPNIGMNISLSGSDIWQSGRVTTHYTITENGSVGLGDYGGTSQGAIVRTEADVPGQMTLLFSFRKPEHYVIAQGADLHEMRVRLIDRARGRGKVMVNEPSGPANGYAVNLESQPAAFKPEAVQQAHDRLKVPIFLSQADVDGVTWYRLRAGPFDKRADAERILGQALQDYPRAWLAIGDDTATTQGAGESHPAACPKTEAVNGFVRVFRATR